MQDAKKDPEEAYYSKLNSRKRLNMDHTPSIYTESALDSSNKKMSAEKFCSTNTIKKGSSTSSSEQNPSHEKQKTLKIIKSRSQRFIDRLPTKIKSQRDFFEKQ